MHGCWRWTTIGIACMVWGCDASQATTPKTPPTESVVGTATVRPAYYILSLLYDPPGNLSNAGYPPNIVTAGQTSDIAQTFAGTPALTFVNNAALVGVDTGLMFGVDTATESLQSFRTRQLGVPSGNGPLFSITDTVDHTQDAFLLWLNPQVTVSQTGSDSATYQLGTPNGSSGTAEPMDIVMVTVAELQNPGIIPEDLLGSRTINGISVPGLSSLCAQPAHCVAADFGTILGFDSLAMNPPVPGKPIPDQVRYRFLTPATLAGPECAGCNYIINTVFVTDGDQPPDFAQERSYSVGLAAAVETTGTFTLSFAKPGSFVWGIAPTIGPATGFHESWTTLESSTQDCYLEVAVYEDALFHTSATVPIVDPVPPAC